MKRIALGLAGVLVGAIQNLADLVSGACMAIEWRLQGLPPLDMKLVSFRDATFTLSVAKDHPAMLAFADAVARFFRESGGTHYVTFSVLTRDGLYFTITVTPGTKDGQQAMQEVNADLQREVAGLKSIIAGWEEKP